MREPRCEIPPCKPEDVAGYDPRDYGEHCAEFYDWIYPDPGAAQLAALVALAAARPVLELGVGTGRVACALAARGVAVWGIDSSPRMLAKLARRVGADRVRALEADIAQFALPLRFGLILSLMDTLALLPPARQSCALACVASHLEMGGRLLVESYLSDPGAASGAPCTASVDVSSPTGTDRYRPTVYPLAAATFDAMARQAGLRVEAIWSDWRGAPPSTDTRSRITLFRHL